MKKLPPLPFLLAACASPTPIMIRKNVTGVFPDSAQIEKLTADNPNGASTITDRKTIDRICNTLRELEPLTEIDTSQEPDRTGG